MKKVVCRIGAFLMMFSLLCGLFFNPQTYKADVTKNYTKSGDDLTVVTYLKSNGARFDTTTTTTLATDYTTIRMWVYFGESIPKGSKVNLSLVLNSGAGAVGSVVGWFGQQKGQGYETEIVHSADVSFSYAGNGKLSYAKSVFNITADTTALCVDFTYSSRSSTSIYLNCVKLVMNCECPEPVVSELEDLNTTSNSLLDNIKNMFTGQSNIFNYLKSTWNYVKNLPNDIASSLGNFFTNLGDYITAGTGTLKLAFDSGMTALREGLPEGIKTSLGGLLGGILTAVDSVYDVTSNVVSSVKELPKNIGEFFTTLGDKIGGFFSPLTNKVSEIFDGFFKNEDKSEIDGISGADVPVDELEGKLDDIVIEKNSDDYNVIDVGQIVNGEPTRLVASVFDCILSCPYVLRAMSISLSFAFAGFVFFGKR